MSGPTPVQEAWHGSLGRLMLMPVDDPADWLAPTYFPESIDRTYGVQYASATLPGHKTKAHQFVSGDERGLTLSLLFDSERRHGGDAAYTHPRHVEAWCDRNLPTFGPGMAFEPGTALKGRPAFRIVMFRSLVAFDVIIQRASVRTTELSREGVPTRVTMDVDAVRHDPLVFRNAWMRTRKAVRPSIRETAPFSEVPGDFAGYILTPGGTDPDREAYLAKVDALDAARRVSTTDPWRPMDLVRGRR